MKEFSYQKDTKVGEKVYDILSKPQADVQVGEIVEEYARKYFASLHEAVEMGLKEGFKDPFHIVVLHKKEPWAVNVVRNWFVTRQSRPRMNDLWTQYPNFMHTVYQFSTSKDKIEMLWTLPSPQEARTIVRNSQLYDAQLCEWCRKALRKEEIIPEIQQAS